MTEPAWVASDTLQTRTLPRLPERVSGGWCALLLAGDALAAAIATLVAGLPLRAVPSVCLLLCAAAWFAGGVHLSYAVRSRDQVYHALATVLVAIVPVFVALVFIGGFDALRSIACVPLALILLCPLHVGMHSVRYSGAIPESGNDAVSPRAKRHVTSPGFRSARRVADAIVAAIAGALLSPLMLAIALVVLQETGGPVFFAQERVGRDRHRFTIYKFRTMCRGAGEQWAKPGDGRVTRTGAFLRRTSLDELPQLANVLKGEMSLVGPRPEMPEYAHEFRSTIPHYDDRTLVDPGMTGWAQINAARNMEPSEVAKIVPYDLFYVEHVSFSLDLYIAIKTLCEIAFHRAV